MSPGAIFSPCRNWRYALTRHVSPSPARLLVIGLNPSTADEWQDDPTIRRCISLARRMDCGYLDMGNLFAWRSTEPKALRLVDDPVGPETDRILSMMASHATVVLYAWGNGGIHQQRGQAVARLLHSHGIVTPFCLGITGKGQPRHPLYLAQDTAILHYIHCEHGGVGL